MATRPRRPLVSVIHTLNRSLDTKITIVKLKIQSYNSTLVLIIFLILIDVLLKDNLSVRYV